MKTIHLDLYDPGMTTLHSAGLGALAATLLAWERAERRGEFDRAVRLGSLTWTVERERVTLSFEEQDAQSLVKMVHTAMWCDEEGSLRFWLLEHGGAPPALPLVIQLQEGLAGTLLQHNKYRTTLEPARGPRVVEIDGEQRVFNNQLRLKDIAHRVEAAELVGKDGRLVEGPIEIKGWAMPGAAKRHETVSGSVLSEPPERFLCLLFGVLGALPFRISSRVGGNKYSWALVAPRVVDLRRFGDARRELLATPRFLVAAGAGDAALKMWARLAISSELDGVFSECEAVALGSVPWASQQQTRTDLLRYALPEDPPARARLLARAAALEEHFAPRLSTNKDGGSFWSVPAWRTLLADNLARDQPLWRGIFAVSSQDPDVSMSMFNYERLNVASFVHALMEEQMLGTDQQEQFVKVWHAAISGRYRKLYERAREENIDGGTLVGNEYERLRAELGRCKNAATLRAAVIDFWARAGGSDEARESWRDMLRFFDSEHWELARDLSLLALASYKGRSSKRGEEVQVGEVVDPVEG